VFNPASSVTGGGALPITALPDLRIGRAGARSRSMVRPTSVILALLDKPPPTGSARWTGPLSAQTMEDVVAAFPDRELHVILDNLNTHKKCERWLKKHPKAHFHFIPTRSSWLNQIET
jgi:hypothetical protein